MSFEFDVSQFQILPDDVRTPDSVCRWLSVLDELETMVAANLQRATRLQKYLKVNYAADEN